MIQTHRHHTPGRYTYALVLAKLCLDRQAGQTVAELVGDCWLCWREISEQLAGHITSDLLAQHGIPTLHPSGLVEGAAVDAVCANLQGMIDAADADARDAARYYGDGTAA